MGNGEKWKTAITDIKPNKILLRGYPIDKLMGKISYAQAVYLALKGELPDEKTGKLLDAMLVSSIDHGVTPPSALATLIAASTGAPINAAIASGVLAVNKYHGGAIEDAMKAFYEIRSRVGNGNNLEKIVEDYIVELKEKKKRIMGFGHRFHSNDPRTRKLFQLAEEAGVGKEFIEIARTIEKVLKKITGRDLPVNVDGAIAAVLCGLGFPREIGNAFFIMSRIGGLVAHYYEEKTLQKPMRKIDPFNWEYDGPGEKEV